MHPDDVRVLYEGWSRPGEFWIRVTTRTCTVNEDRYLLDELSMLAASRGSRSIVRSGKLLRVILLGFAVTVAVVAIANGWTQDLPTAVAITVIGTLAVSGLPSVLGGALRRPYQIWAQADGAPVLLFETYDAEQHGQVSRALVRAQESHAN